MQRTRDMRRAERQRVITRRHRMMRVWTFPADHRWFQEPGRLSKYNLKCTCGLCKLDRYSRAKTKQDNISIYRQDDCMFLSDLSDILD